MSFVRGAAALTMAGLLLTARARADDIADARQHFSEGVRRFEDGDFEGARRLFLQADKEHHAPVLLYNLARAEERLGHAQAAVDEYEKYLAEAGPKEELAQAAAVAVADLRARSSRVRVESTPAGARVFVDGSPLDEPTPTSVLLFAGLHHVVVEGDGWRAPSDVEVKAGGEQTVSLTSPSLAGTPPPVSSAPAPLPLAPPPIAPPSTPPPDASAAGPDGLVYGGTFLVVPYDFLGADQGASRTGVGGVDVGLTAEIGYAFAPHAEIVIRGFGALGSECPNLLGSHFVSAGPAINYQLARWLWLGASLLGGNAETCRGANVYSTDIVFSPSFDVSFAVATHTYGQWIISASLAYYFANPANDNRVFYVPIGFGVRFY